VLEPDDRRVLLEALRPPEGYVVDAVVATTYTLDLVALLTAPLAFSLYDQVTNRDRADGSRPEPLDSFALLHAVRQHAEGLTVFCEAGLIAPPKKYRQLLAYLEGSIVQVRAPSEDGLFHAKIWLQRFVAPQAPIRYRLLCSSRNLTFDRSWDTMLVLDGELADRTRPFKENHPLADFISALPGLALRPLSRRKRDGIENMADEVRRVRFDLPEGFDSIRFWPMGYDGKNVWPFEARIERLLIVSPFVSAVTLRDLTKAGAEHVLVSRIDQMEPVATDVLERFSALYVLHDAAEEIEEDTEGFDGLAVSTNAASKGLHAKLYVVDDGWNAHIWTGSANATDAAFHRNVEFLVQLTGKRSRFGVGVTLDGTKVGDGLRSLLAPFTVPVRPIEADDIQQRLDERLRSACRALARFCWVATVERTSETPELYDVVLGAHGDGILLAADIDTRCWPIALSQSRAMDVRGGGPGVVARFAGCSFQALTTFFAFQVRVSEGDRICERTFVIHIALEGLPEDRGARVLQGLLDDSAKVLRYLRLLLTLDPADALDGVGFSDLKEGKVHASEPSNDSSNLSLLESLVRALDRDPGRLIYVEQLVRELGGTSTRLQTLPVDFHRVWEPLWAAHQFLYPKRGRA
jgi:hypothetical protein